MKLGAAAAFLLASTNLLEDRLVQAQEFGENDIMTKMCLFYPNPSGHARSDPILNQACPSDHVHTFYGPVNIHPNTSSQQLVNTKPQFSSSPFVENQSLYWHPSIYRVTQENGQTKYSLVEHLETGPYYRWNTANTPEETVEFPQGFRMIAFSDQPGADAGGETGRNLLVECCNRKEDRCTVTGGKYLDFPTQTSCDSVEIGFAMPTCWDESKGDGSAGDPFNHVAYTTDGRINGPCPPGFNKRIPQIQLFVRIENYQGGTYQLSDGNRAFHVDFMNGWEEGKLAQIKRANWPKSCVIVLRQEMDTTRHVTVINS